MKQGRTENFTKNDVDKAVLRALWLNDQRSFDRWFHFLFSMEFIVQPKPGHYRLTSKILELDVNVEEEQRRLFNI